MQFAAAARRQGDRAGRAHAHGDLATAHILAGRLLAARRHLRRAIGLFHALNRPNDQACAYATLCILSCEEGDHQAALRHARHALDLFRRAGNPGGEARMLNSVGWVLAQLGRYREAAAYCRRALVFQRRLGDRERQGYTWDSLGYAYGRLGDRPRAIRCYERAWLVGRAMGNVGLAAGALVELGDLRQTAGEVAAAAHAWRQALDVLGDLDHPLVHRIRERLG